MRIVKIRDIAEIFSGHTARGKINPVTQGHLIVQLKDIGIDGGVNVAGLDRIAEAEFKAPHLITSGDLVFRSRGQLLTVGVVPYFGEPVAVISPLMKISVDSSMVLPEFLCWMINNTPGQSYFAGQAVGTVIKMIGKSTLSEMQLSLPSLEDQRKIIELWLLRKKEAELSEAITKKTEQLINTRIMRFLEEA
jgi:restriction endonuclease S subunit